MAANKKGEKDVINKTRKITAKYQLHRTHYSKNIRLGMLQWGQHHKNNINIKANKALEFL